MNANNLAAQTARRWMVALGLLAAATLAHAANLPDGWAARFENNGTTFAPVRMNPGERFEVWVAGTLFDAPQGASQMQLIRQQAGVQGGQCEPAQVTQNNVVMQDCMDGNMALQYMLIPSHTGAGKVQLVRVRAAGSDEALARYRDGFQQVLRLVLQGQAQTQVQTMQRGEDQPQTAPRGQPQAQPQTQTQPETARADGVPDGWQARYDENYGIIFEPVKMDRGEKLEIWVYRSYQGIYEAKGASAQARLAKMREKAKAMDGDCQPPQDAPPGKVLAMQLCKDGDAVLQYILLRHGMYSSQLLRVRAAGNGVLERYKDGFQQVMQLASQGKVSEVASGYIAQAVRTAPGQGVSDGDIAAVHIEWEQVRNGTTLRMEYTTRVLLKDGTGYAGSSFPPDEFNVKVSRQLEPGRWFQWRKPLFGKDYQKRNRDGQDWRSFPRQGWFAQPARSGERLNGAYGSSAGYGSSIVGTLRTTSSTWYFNNDGTFSTSFFARTTTGAMESLNGHSVGTTTLSNSKGTSSSTSVSETPSAKTTATPIFAGGINRRSGDGADRRGRYRLSGWVLEVERDDGSTGRYFVSFQGDKRDNITIGGTQYSLPRK